MEAIAKQKKRLLLAEKIAQAWNENCLLYTVVHGLYDYPNRIGRDIDILIYESSVLQAIKIAIIEGKRNNFNSVLYRWSYWGLHQLVLIDTITMSALPLDFMCTTTVWQAKFIDLLNNEEIDRIISSSSQIGSFKISHEGVFLKACVRPLVCGDLSRFGEEKEFPLPVKIPEKANLNLLEDIIGDYGLKILKVNNIEVLININKKITFELQFRWIKKHPIRAIKNIYTALKRRLLIEFFNYSNVVTINSQNPEVLKLLLEKESILFKSIFIDLKVINESNLFSPLYGYFLKWRKKPVSEFILYVNIQKKVCLSTGVQLKRGRFYFEPDAHINIDSNLSQDKIRLVLIHELIDFMLKSHSFVSNAN